MRNIKKGDLVAVGRTERGEDGIFVFLLAFEMKKKKIKIIYLLFVQIHQEKHHIQKVMMIYMKF